MLWFLIGRILLVLARWLWPVAPVATSVDPNMPCAACGNRKGSLSFTRVVVNGEAPTSCIKCDSEAIAWVGNGYRCNECGDIQLSAKAPESVLQHTCGVCGYSSLVKTINEVS